MNKYDKELERIIKYTLAYMIDEKEDDGKDACMSIVWKTISDKLQRMNARIR